MRGRTLPLLLAVGLDLVFGEPRSRWHPVAGFGRGLRWLEGRLPRRTASRGTGALLAGLGVSWALGWATGGVARRLGWKGVLLEAVALKVAFSARGLREAADSVREALEGNRLDEARRLVGWHLVSRPVEDLSAAHVASATVESVAENLTDSVVAPLGCYALWGLPGAWAYRALNTADAMWGYRDPRYERLGKAAARLDDLANLLPARLAAGMLAAGAHLAGEDGRAALRVMRRDHRATASPNAGWTMAAMAGALGVSLEKPGAYRLGEGALPDSPVVIRRAIRVFAAATALAVGAAVAFSLARGGR